MKNSTQTLIAVVVMGALSVGNIAFVESGIWQTGKAEEISILSMDAGAYQVEALQLQKDGRYTVTGSAAGFQSDVKLSVTFDVTGNSIEDVKVLSQAETMGLGTKITDADFTDRFSGIQAPVGLSGKEIAVGSPTAKADGESTVKDSHIKGAPANVRRDPATWNIGDQTAEAQSARALYNAGLLSTAVESREMKTAYKDMPAKEKAMASLYRSGLSASAVKKQPMAKVAANLSAKEQTVQKLYQAGLLASAAAGEEYEPVAADLSAEGQAINRLDQAGLLVKHEQQNSVEAEDAEKTSAAISEIDAVSGATVSSTAAVTAVNNCYYFLRECVLK